MAEAPRIEPAELMPWHAPAAAQLRAAWTAGRLPHGLVISGAEGLGLPAFANWIASAVLCDDRAQFDPCGHCASCQLVSAATHPDLHWIVPEEGKQQIAIEQVRGACERLAKTSYRQGYKVAIFDPSHQMTIAAANSLLKTLEEPAAGSLIILLTSRLTALLPTIRSRCLKLPVRSPSQEQTREWLAARGVDEISTDVVEFAGGAPLRALDYAQGRFQALNEEMVKGLKLLFSGQGGVAQVASKWADEQLPDRLTWLDLWLTSLARKVIDGTANRVTFPSGPVHLPSPEGALNISSVYSMVDRARALKAQLGRTALQRELAVESWLIALLDVVAPRGAARNQPSMTPMR